MPGLLRCSNLRLICLSVLLFLVIAAGNAQNDNGSRNSLSDFFNSIAKLTYNAAWPTATYRSWDFDTPVRDVGGGYDVVIKLSGISGLGGSDLWLKLGFAFRSGSLSRTWVVSHNAWVMPPFKTLQTLGQITADLAKQYQQSQSQTGQPTPAATPTPQEPTRTESGSAAAVCLKNGTDATLNFKYHWGDDAWSADKLDAGKAYIYWFTMQNGETTAPRFFIEYVNSFEVATLQDYELERYAVTLPTKCDAAKEYVFSTSGTKILLQGAN